MAEAIAAVGLAAAIAQFVDYARKVASRIQEFQSDMNSVPKSLQDITNVLPLLLVTLERTQQQAQNTQLGIDIERALLTVIDGCRNQVCSLDELLVKTLPAQNDSSFRRKAKAFMSVAKDSKIEKVSSRIKNHIQVLTYYQTTTTLPPVSQTKSQACFNVKFERDENFVGRGEILTKLDERFQSGQQAALTGIGGVGKSQIAIEYCYQFRDKIPEGNVFWIFAASASRMQQEYQDIAKKLNLRGSNEPQADAARLVCQWLESDESGRWLLVLDNIDDISVMSQSTEPNSSGQQQILRLPQNPRGCLLLTTRDKRVGDRLVGNSFCFEVPTMSIEDATCLFCNHSQLDGIVPRKDDLIELFETLNFLPLAITQASAFINQNSITLREYLRLLLHENTEEIGALLREEIGDRRRDAESESSVLRTWRLCFEAIWKQRPRAAEILSLMANLERQNIFRYLIREKSDSDLDFTLAMGTLQAFQLVKSDDQGGSYHLHRLVQLATIDWLQSRHEQILWQSAALAAVEHAFPLPCSAQDWPLSESLLAHALKVVQRSFETEDDILLQFWLFSKLGRLEFTKWGYMAAEKYFRKSLTLPPPSSQDYIRERVQVGWLLGHSLCQLKRYSESEQYLTATIQFITKQASNLRSPKIWLCRLQSELGRVYRKQKRLVEAENLLQQVVHEYQSDKSEGEVDIKTQLSVQSKLAIVYLEQGKADEAVELQTRILEQSRLLGSIAFRQTNDVSVRLALSLVAKKDFTKAKSTIFGALKEAAEVLGKTHPETISVVARMAILYFNCEELSTSRDLHAIAFKKRDATSGPLHALTLDSLTNLALFLFKTGWFEESKELYQELAARWEKVYGEDHEETRKSLQGLEAATAAVQTPERVVLPQDLSKPNDEIVDRVEKLMYAGELVDRAATPHDEHHG